MLMTSSGYKFAVVCPLGHIDGVWANNNDAARLGRVVVRVSDYTGVDQDGLRIESTGSATAFGFYMIISVTITLLRNGYPHDFGSLVIWLFRLWVEENW